MSLWPLLLEPGISHLLRGGAQHTSDWLALSKSLHPFEPPFAHMSAGDTERTYTLYGWNTAQVHSLTYHLWQFLHYKAELNSWDRLFMAQKAYNIYFLAPYRKSVQIHALECPPLSLTSINPIHLLKFSSRVLFFRKLF